MRNKLLTSLMCSLYFTSLGITPVFAEETQVDVGFDVDSFYEETLSMFSDMKSDYSDLANNYGTVPLAEGETVYMDYLNNVSRANEALQYDDKLKAIQNADISINDAELSAAYQKAKSDVQSKLKSSGIDITASATDFDRKVQSNNEATRSMMTSVSESSERYQKLVDWYKENGDKKNPHDTYNSQNLQSLFDEMSDSEQKSNPLTTSSQFKGSFQSAESLFNKINSGLVIDEIMDVHDLENADVFLERSEKAIQAYVDTLTEEEMDDEMQGEIDAVQEACQTLTKAIEEENIEEMSECMQTIDAFLNDYGLEILEETTETEETTTEDAKDK